MRKTASTCRALAVLACSPYALRLEAISSRRPSLLGWRPSQVCSSPYARDEPARRGEADDKLTQVQPQKVDRRPKGPKGKLRVLQEIQRRFDLKSFAPRKTWSLNTCGSFGDGYSESSSKENTKLAPKVGGTWWNWFPQTLNTKQGVGDIQKDLGGQLPKISRTKR